MTAILCIESSTPSRPVYSGLFDAPFTAVQVHLLKSQELSGISAGKPKRPRVLVLGPTRELTDQILQVAKSLSHSAKFRSACVNGGGNGRHVTHGFFAPQPFGPFC